MSVADYITRNEAIRALQINLGDYCSARRALCEIPAADVAPVVHGRWDGNTCTACKLPWNYQMVQDADDWGYFDPMPDYCPNCGAIMDRKDDEKIG